MFCHTQDFLIARGLSRKLCGRVGLPLKTDGEPALPGLWFVGFVPTLGGQLREGSLAARKVAESVLAGFGAV